MKISYSWLKEYLPVKLPAAKTASILTDIGLEVSSIEHKGVSRKSLDGLVVGFVASVDRHPNADRLRLAKVDTGNGKLLSIVCGATNIALGQKVVVAPEGTTLHPAGGSPFTIARARIRGEESEGMICAEDEIGLGSSHDGIIVLDPKAVTGAAASRYLDAAEDDIFEIELTPNRPDAMSHLGVARDLAAALQVRTGKAYRLHPPKPASLKTGKGPPPITVTVKDRAACPRYSGITITGTRVCESPAWLSSKLNSIGIRPVNNVVDATNFVLHEMGQPLHAFDADEIAGRKVIVRMAQKGEKLVTLDGIERSLSMHDLMICDADKSLCIGGVFGGIKSGISENTKNIFLESAWFSPEHIRRTSIAHGLRTEAALRFEKGTDPTMTIAALLRAAAIIIETGGGKIPAPAVDVYPVPFREARIKMDPGYVARMTGESFPAAELRKILIALGMKVSAAGKKTAVAVPAFKSDVKRPADVLEEVLRIYGYNRINPSSRIKLPPFPAHSRSNSAMRTYVSEFLAAAGFSEIISTSMSDPEYYKKSVPLEDVVELRNGSAGLDVLRRLMLFSGLDAVRHNTHRQQHDLKLFEFGFVYRQEKNSIREEERLSLILAGSHDPENWRSRPRPADLYDLKAVTVNILKRLGIGDCTEEPVPGLWFSSGVRYSSGGAALAELGKVKKSILTETDIRGDVWYADIFWDRAALASPVKITGFAPPRYPSIRRDLAMVLDKKVPYSEVLRLAREGSFPHLRQINLFDVYEDEKIGRGRKSIAVSFIFRDDAATLTDADVDRAMERMEKLLEENLGAQIRK